MAATEAELSRMALSGISTDRKITPSISAVVPSTRAISSGKRRSRSCWKSTVSAAYPPTSSRAPRSPRMPSASSMPSRSDRIQATISMVVVSEVVSATMASTTVVRASGLR